MKRNYVKGFSVLMAVMLILTSSYGQVHAQAANSADIVNDTAGVSSLLGKINDAREGVSKAALTQDLGLDKVAYAYASELINAGSGFRKTTDFKTLPNGESVFSLAAANGVTGISNFNYSVWLGGYPNLELTNEFANKAINGDFTKVGIACCTDASGYKVVVLMFSKETPLMRTDEPSSDKDINGNIMPTDAGSIDMNGMNLFWQRDNIQFVADDNAKLSIYVNAEKNENGDFVIDDGQDWVVLMETSLGDYPLFPRQYVQLGGVSCTVFNDYADNDTISHVLVTVRQTASYQLYDCVFDSDNEVFKVTMIYDAKGINFITTSKNY